jgi:hypothetical protein
MSEEIEETQDEAEELMFWEGGQLLQTHRWGSYSTGNKDTQEYLALKAEIEGKLAKGEPVYVQIMDERRKGSVGRLSKITFDYRPSGSQTRNYWGSRYEDYLGIRDIEVVWDGRKNKCSPMPNEVEYLPNWTGGTEWQWTKGPSKEKPPRVVPYDSLGQEIEPGQFVCFVHRRYGNISMKFGSVTRLTDKGGVFVKTLKLRDGERAGEELKAFEAQHLLIVNDKLMGRLMMARLSAD